MPQSQPGALCLVGSISFIGDKIKEWPSIPNYPGLRGFQGHRTFHVKRETIPGQQGWVGHLMRGSRERGGRRKVCVMGEAVSPQNVDQI